jgi:hypothetical protein
VETGIRDNRKSLPDPVPHTAAALQGSQFRGFRVWGPEPWLHLLFFLGQEVAPRSATLTHDDYFTQQNICDARREAETVTKKEN